MKRSTFLGMAGAGFVAAQSAVTGNTLSVGGGTGTSELNGVQAEIERLGLLLETNRRYHLLANEQKYILKIIYREPGIRVRDVARKLELAGVLETARAIHSVRGTGFVSFGSPQLHDGMLSQEHLYPAENLAVAGEIEFWLSNVDDPAPVYKGPSTLFRDNLKPVADGPIEYIGDMEESGGWYCARCGGRGHFTSGPLGVVTCPDCKGSGDNPLLTEEQLRIARSGRP